MCNKIKLKPQRRNCKNSDSPLSRSVWYAVAASALVKQRWNIDQQKQHNKMSNTDAVWAKHPNVLWGFSTYSAIVTVIIKVIPGAVQGHQQRLSDHGWQLPSEARGEEELWRCSHAAHVFAHIVLVKRRLTHLATIKGIYRLDHFYLWDEARHNKNNLSNFPEFRAQDYCLLHPAISFLCYFTYIT